MTALVAIRNVTKIYRRGPEEVHALDGVTFELRPGELVRFKLEFLRPFKATNTAEFTFKQQGNQTVVTWGIFGKNNFMSKAVGLFMNMDKMVGSQLEQGLAQMKSVAEAAGKS